MTTPAYPTITEELLAEIEEELALCEELDCNAAVTPNHLGALLHAISLLRAENAELKADKARLDSGMIITQERDGTGREYKCHRRGLDLRAMIDEANDSARSSAS